MPLNKKQRGILLHFSSLPGEFGIGDLGYAARSFARFLHESGFQIWQVLPLNHRGYGNSPYNPISAFALDPLLISPELLYEDGLIDAAHLEAARLPNLGRVFFEQVNRAKAHLTDIAASRFLSRNDIQGFLSQNDFWLKPYIAFQTLDRLYGYVHWNEWQVRHRCYSETLWLELLKDFEPYMLSQAAVQAILRQQLGLLRNYLKELGIELWGDLPIYLSYHSSEVWAHPDLFQLNAQGARLKMAGVPPDAFSEDGQLWGNPIYRWEEKPREVFSLFENRVEDALRYMDRLRLDHFIGYVNYWSVPSLTNDKGEAVMPDHARDGAWIQAPGEQLFENLTARFGSQPFIAEDLGILTEQVCKVRERFGFPGMIVLQFCWQDPEPRIHDYPADRVIYTGTHDNPTTRQWFEELVPGSNEYISFRDYVNSRADIWPLGLDASNSASVMMDIALQSGCDICVFPMQDLLGLGAEARMNIPGTPLGNWEWRMPGPG